MKPMTAHQHYEAARALLDSADEVWTENEATSGAMALAAAKMAEVHVMLGDRAAEAGECDWPRYKREYVRPVDQALVALPVDGGGDDA